MTYVGQPLDRTDGVLKVTGGARYAAEYPQPRLVHAVLVMSTIAKGRIASMDSAAAQRMPGVVYIMTPFNAMRLPKGGRAAVKPPAGRVLTLLQDDRVYFQNQPIAVVVADTLERARDAADRIAITYAEDTPAVSLDRNKGRAYAPAVVQGQKADTHRGDSAAALAAATVKVDAVYTMAMEHHNPMEPHATIAAWDGESLTVHDATQYISGVQSTVAKTFGMPEARVRVICPFIGGGFGCKGSTWAHVVLAAMAAKHTGRPVKLVLDRPQMFGMVGNRPYTEQRVALGATPDGQFQAIEHDVFAQTSTLEDWVESSAIVTRMLYAVPNLRTSHRLVKLDLGTPTFMRAPGEASGTFALESAIDELAYALQMDPVALRMKNYAEREPEEQLPWSLKRLSDCYRMGAEKFGWSNRPAPGTLREGRERIGWGMATATYPALRSAASAVARVLPDGRAVVASGTQDLGTGTFTVMTQVAADGLGFPVDKVRFELGDSRFPPAPVSGGSQSVASVSAAVRAATQALREKLYALAAADAASPLHGARASDLAIVDGWLVHRTDAQRREAVGTLVGRHGATVEATAKAQPGDERKRFSFHSFGAVFAEVRVDADLGTLRVPRVVAVYDVGRVLNPKTARSQLMGGIVWGVGLALTEASELDLRYGRIVNNNLAEYHVPVNADIVDIDVTVLDVPDPHINPDGARGIGEIGITGVGAAVANAVFHATGKRIRDLPITLDKVMA